MYSRRWTTHAVPLELSRTPVADVDGTALLRRTSGEARMAAARLASVLHAASTHNRSVTASYCLLSARIVCRYSQLSSCHSLTSSTHRRRNELRVAALRSNFSRRQS